MNKEIDISSEEYRIYHYPDGSAVTIPEPETLYVIVWRMTHPQISE